MRRQFLVKRTRKFQQYSLQQYKSFYMIINQLEGEQKNKVSQIFNDVAVLKTKVNR